jgi:TDG/mug DNA glycosylase family protein
VGLARLDSIELPRATRAPTNARGKLSLFACRREIACDHQIDHLWLSSRDLMRRSIVERSGTIRNGQTEADMRKPVPLPDILDHGLVVVFVGINPSPLAAAMGHRFAGPSNRFWRVIHLAGFSPVLLRADQDRTLPQYGCGLISAISRPTRRASELSRSELAAAGDALGAKIQRHRPKWIAFLGKGAYSAIMARRDIAWGHQNQTMGAAQVWVLPDPSGLNRQTLPQLVAAYGALRVAAAGDFAAFAVGDMDCPDGSVQI